MAWEGLDTGPDHRSLLRRLGRLAPEGVRRGQRVECAMEEIYRAARGGGLPVGEFDPSRGASGRPSAVYEHPGGLPSQRGTEVWLSQDRWTERLRWNGFYLTVEVIRGRCRVYTIYQAPHDAQEQRDERGAAREVTEAVLCVPEWNWRNTLMLQNTRDTRAPILQGSLYFLDAEGYAVFVVAAVKCVWEELAHVVESTGIPLSVYAFSFSPEAVGKIGRLLFPHRRQCIVTGNVD